MSTNRVASDLDPDAFHVHRSVVRDNVELAYVREGAGGAPILLLHGWPSTKRVFYRNVAPLAEAGFEVVVPDLRGFGDSPVPADRSQWADCVSMCRDSHALMESLGHERWVVGGFDVGSIASQDMCVRFPEQIVRQIVWSGMTLLCPEEYEKAGLGGSQFEEVLELSDHMMTHGQDPDGLTALLDSPIKRRDYVKGFYTGRVWKAEGGPVFALAAQGFDDDEAKFLAEPYEDEATFRAALQFYVVLQNPELGEPLLLSQPNRNTETLLLFGMEDRICGANFPRRAEVSIHNLVGPFLVEGAGHFLSWEHPRLFNAAVISFCRDLLKT